MKTKKIVRNINLFRYQIEFHNSTEKYLEIFIRENIKTIDKLSKVINNKNLNPVDREVLIDRYIISCIIESDFYRSDSID